MRSHALDNKRSEVTALSRKSDFENIHTKMGQSVATVISSIRIEAIDYANWPSEQSLHYPGPRGFLLYFLGKFRGLRQVIMLTGHQNKAFITLVQEAFFYSFFLNRKKDNIKEKPQGPGTPL